MSSWNSCRGIKAFSLKNSCPGKVTKMITSGPLLSFRVKKQLHLMQRNKG